MNGFTAQELEEIRRADAEIDAKPPSPADIRASEKRDKVFRRLNAQSESRRRYNTRHKAKISERCRRYYQANKARITEYNRQYYHNHRAERVEYKRQYYQDNKPAFAARSRRYYAANRAKILERRRLKRLEAKKACDTAVISSAKA